jgi:8-oxo-dGTP pyrophosphatase MutT (NUDIX family)
VSPPDEIRAVSSRLVYENRWMRVREDELRRADGSPGLYGVVDKPDFALVVPMDDTGFWMVEQYRYPARGRFWEFPQGTWEGAPEADLAEVARGELAEETGLRAETLRPLAVFHESYGITGQRAHAFVATGLTRGDAAPDPEEGDLRCAHVGYADFPAMVAAGRITDSATLAAYGLLLLDRGAAVTGP